MIIDHYCLSRLMTSHADHIAYVSVEALENFTTSTNIISTISLGRLMIEQLSNIYSISTCLSVKRGGSTYSVSCVCTGREHSSHVSFVSSESKYGFKRKTLSSILVCAPSLFVKE